jgi:poly-beta-1,6-N-acetyl-D-glucosamine synthase
MTISAYPSNVPQPVYVILTAAYNEEENIGKTIESVLAQTLLPKLWVIVSDGSTDGTDKIVQQYAEKNGFIRFLRRSRTPGHNFGAKVRALQSGMASLAGVEYHYIGNMDADLTIEPSYFENLIERFNGNPRLGIAGGFVFEEYGGVFRSRRSNRTYSVAHAGQLVRRECYEAIVGYTVLEYGGEDWHAQTNARMKGWEARAFPELPIYHHRHTGEGDVLIRHRFRQGRMDHSFGSDPLFEILKCLERLPERPFVIGGMARLLGFAWSYLCDEKRPVSDQFVAFLRNEQRVKLRSQFIRHPTTRRESFAKTSRT